MILVSISGTLVSSFVLFRGREYFVVELVLFSYLTHLYKCIRVFYLSFKFPELPLYKPDKNSTSVSSSRSQTLTPTSIRPRTSTYQSSTTEVSGRFWFPPYLYTVIIHGHTSLQGFIVGCQIKRELKLRHQVSYRGES